MIAQFDVSILGELKRTDRHRIAGTILVNGQPASRFVAAYDRRRFSWLASTISDPVTGSWEISGLPELPLQSLLVVSLDTTGTFNAEVADYISQVATE